MGGHDGHGSGPNFPHGVKMPDPKQWDKIDENFPELIKYRDRLARKGLKDPWIRDYAWAYDVRKVKPWDGYKAFFSGFKIGLACFAAIVIKKTFYDKPIDRTDRYPLLRERQDREFS